MSWVRKKLAAAGWNQETGGGDDTVMDAGEEEVKETPFWEHVTNALGEV